MAWLYLEEHSSVYLSLFSLSLSVLLLLSHLTGQPSPPHSSAEVIWIYLSLRYAQIHTHTHTHTHLEGVAFWLLPVSLSCHSSAQKQWGRKLNLILVLGVFGP